MTGMIVIETISNNIMKLTFFAMHCISDQTAQRNCEKGSLFIQDICEIVGSQAADKHLEDMFKQVSITLIMLYLFISKKTKMCTGYAHLCNHGYCR